MRRNTFVSLIETGLAITFWAVSFVFSKIALGEISPVTLIVIRFLSGALVLGAVAAWRGEFAQLKPGDWKAFAVLGTAGIALQQLLQVNGQVTASAGAAAFLASSAPAFLVAIGAVIFREKVTFWQAGGVLLATAGAGWVAAGGNLGDFQFIRAELTGNVLVLLSAVVWAVFTLMVRKIVAGRPTILTTAAMFFFGFLVVLPLFIGQQSWNELNQLTPRGAGSLAFVCVFGTAVAYLLYGHALKNTEASRLAAIQNVEPLITLVAAALILQEPVTSTLLTGGAAILTGVFLAERNAPAAQSAQPAHEALAVEA